MRRPTSETIDAAPLKQSLELFISIIWTLHHKLIRELPPLMGGFSTSSAGLSWLIALLAEIEALAAGVPAIDTVAIQCIVGRSFEKYFVFNGPINAGASYRGIQLAFGANREMVTSKSYSYNKPHGRHLTMPELTTCWNVRNGDFMQRFGSEKRDTICRLRCGSR